MFQLPTVTLVKLQHISSYECVCVQGSMQLHIFFVHTKLELIIGQD